jgi:hypothetical protein
LKFGKSNLHKKITNEEGSLKNFEQLIERLISTFNFCNLKIFTNRFYWRFFFGLSNHFNERLISTFNICHVKLFYQPFLLTSFFVRRTASTWKHQGLSVSSDPPKGDSWWVQRLARMLPTIGCVSRPTGVYETGQTRLDNRVKSLNCPLMCRVSGAFFGECVLKKSFFLSHTSLHAKQLVIWRITIYQQLSPW